MGTEHGEREANDERMAEYNTLREEIIARQNHRLIILGYTLTVMGTAGTLSFQPNQAPEIILGLAVFSFLSIVGALLLTVQHTQMNHHIAGYIRESVEAVGHGGMCWETWWHTTRMAKRDQLSPRSRRIAPLLPLGQSKPLALFYLVLTVSAVWVFLPLVGSGEPMYVVIAFAAASLLLAMDFYFCLLPWWRELDYKATPPKRRTSGDAT